MWGSDLSGTMQGAGGVGGLLAFKDSVHFVHYDGNGNVSALVNAADGTISAEYEYGPFGESMRAETLVAKVNPVQFSSKYRDQETDWVQYPFRYYIPQAGRWASRDPIGEIGGLNDYALLDNGPVAFVDPLGLFKPKYHREITLEALKNSGLSPELLEVIATANVAQDAGAIMGIAGGNRNKPFFDPVNHGDDNRIKETIARIGDRLKKAADNKCLTCKDVEAALSELGAALHAVQDLYAHSTYVETFGKSVAAKGTLPIWRFLKPNGEINVPEGVITGNYKYPRDNGLPPTHKSINKDAPDSPRGQVKNEHGISYFELASDAATRHTAALWEDLNSRLTPEQRQKLKECSKQ